MIDLQFGNTMSLNPGVYWLGVVKKEASANAAAGLSLAMAGNVMPGFSPVGLSSAALSSNSTIRGPHYLGFGPYNAATGAIPGSAAISSINHTGTVMPLMTFIST